MPHWAPHQCHVNYNVDNLNSTHLTYQQPNTSDNKDFKRLFKHFNQLVLGLHYALQEEKLVDPADSDKILYSEINFSKLKKIYSS